MQLTLFEPPPAGRRNDCLFFALFPDPATAASIARLARRVCSELRVPGRIFPPERFHLSLFGLGNYAGPPEILIDAARIAAARVTMPAFEIRLHRVRSFTGGRTGVPFVLQGSDEQQQEPLASFRNRLGTALFRRASSARFNPHVTLCWSWATFAGREVEPLTWTVREFALVHSLQGRTKYVFLGRWPLGPQ